MKVAICTPVHGDPKLGYTRSLMHLGVLTERTGGSVGLAFEYLSAVSPNLAFARTELVKAARGIGADRILWIDPDMAFPQDSLLRLLAKRERVVGANSIAADGLGPAGRALDGTPLLTTADKAKAHLLELCLSPGLGLALMDIAIFDEIEAPWFDTGWDEAGAPTSEANHFFARLHAAGIPVHVDHGLSWQVARIADRPLTHSGAMENLIREGVVRSRLR